MDFRINLSAIIQILTIIVGFAYFIGQQKTTLKSLENSVKKDINFIDEKIDRLEKKQDKHNGLIERMVIVEQSTKSSHHRLDEFEHRLDSKE